MRAKAVRGVWSESGTTADRFDSNKESAKHRMPECQSRMQKHGLRHSSGFPCFYAVSIVYYFSAVTPLSVYCCPRVETVMIRLPALSDYHRLAFPETGSSISLEIFSSNICHSFSPSWKLSSSYYAVISTQEALLARN